MSNNDTQTRLLDQISGVYSANKKYNLHRSLAYFGNQWRLIILYELLRQGPLSYTQLRISIPTITNTTLLKTLEELLEIEAITKDPSLSRDAAIYSLTQKGQDLMPIYVELCKWINKYYEDIN